MAQNESYVGARKEIAFSKEINGFGVAVTPQAGDWQPHMGFGFTPLVNKVKDEPGLGRIEDNSNSAVTDKSSSGKVPLRITKDFIGHVLNMWYGQSPSTVNNGNGTYTSTWALLNSNAHQSYTITVKSPVAGALQYALARAKQLDFAYKVKSIATVDVEVDALFENRITPVTSIYSTLYDLPFYVSAQINVYLAATIAGLATATPISVNDFNFTVVKNTTPAFDLGSFQPTDIPNNLISIGGKAISRYLNTVFRDLAFSNIKQAMKIVLDDGQGNVITHVFPRVSFESWKTSTDNKKFLENDYGFFLEKDSVNGFGYSTVTNLVSAY